MNKEFVTYNIAKQLKDLGFREKCFKRYSSSGYLSLKIGQHPENFNANVWAPEISAPLYQQAFRFFREKYDLHAGFDNNISGYYTLVREKDKNSSLYLSRWANTEEHPFKTYEEAQIACLQALIKIIETIPKVTGIEKALIDIKNEIENK